MGNFRRRDGSTKKPKTRRSGSCRSTRPSNKRRNTRETPPAQVSCLSPTTAPALGVSFARTRSGVQKSPQFLLVVCGHKSTLLVSKVARDPGSRSRQCGTSLRLTHTQKACRRAGHSVVCVRQGSNLGPDEYKSSALPTELRTPLYSIQKSAPMLLYRQR